MEIFLKDSTVSPTYSNAKYHYSKISIKLIRQYYYIFRKLIHDHVQTEISTLILDGPVDESLLYKIKRGEADGRLAKIRIWLVALKFRTRGKLA